MLVGIPSLIKGLTHQKDVTSICLHRAAASLLQPFAMSLFQGAACVLSWVWDSASKAAELSLKEDYCALPLYSSLSELCLTGAG